VPSGELWRTPRTSENALHAKFVEFLKGEVRRMEDSASSYRDVHRAASIIIAPQTQRRHLDIWQQISGVSIG
jgi:hypothetical protein